MCFIRKCIFTSILNVKWKSLLSMFFSRLSFRFYIIDGSIMIFHLTFRTMKTMQEMILRLQWQRMILLLAAETLWTKSKTALDWVISSSRMAVLCSQQPQMPQTHSLVMTWIHLEYIFNITIMSWTWNVEIKHQNRWTESQWIP